MSDQPLVTGEVIATLTDPEGNVVGYCRIHNLVTDTGDAFAAAGRTPAVTGMKLGTGSTPPAKNGAGAALTTYLSDSHQALSGAPSVVGNVVTYSATWPAGKATTASAITECVLVNDALTDATSPAGNVVARALLSGIASKPASSPLTINWPLTFQGVVS